MTRQAHARIWIKKLLTNGYPIPWWPNTFVFNYYSTKSKKQQEQGGKNNPASNICIIYYMGIYSGTNHGLHLVSSWQSSFKWLPWLLQRHSRQNPEVCNMKRKATNFNFGWRWSLSLKSGCKLENPSFLKQHFRYKSISTYRVWDHATYSETLQAAQHNQGHKSKADMGWNRAVVGTHLCARPRHIAAISREGRPVMSPSICERIPLISSVTIGLCMQLKFSFSCRVEINGP